MNTIKSIINTLKDLKIAMFSCIIISEVFLLYSYFNQIIKIIILSNDEKNNEKL